MQHTIAVFTHAHDASFNANDILRYSKIEAPDYLVPDYGKHLKPSLQKFLIDDVDERILGVENHIQSEYERTRMRDALIELIDVVQSQQQGKPYRHIYFDRAEQKIRKYRIEEQMAREKLCEHECKR